jgi:hypothetical protein
MSVSPISDLREQEKREYAQLNEIGAAPGARLQSPDVAEVVNRPKKRPGRRLRSSITIRAANKQAVLV